MQSREFALPQKRKRDPEKSTPFKKPKASTVRLFQEQPQALNQDEPSVSMLAARKTWDREAAANFLFALGNYCYYLQMAPDAKKEWTNLMYTGYDLYKLATAWGCTNASKKLTSMRALKINFLTDYEKTLANYKQALLNIENTSFSQEAFIKEVNDVMYEIQTYFANARPSTAGMSVLLEEWFAFLCGGKSGIADDIAVHASERLEKKETAGLSL